jgi:hypothetical protein
MTTEIEIYKLLGLSEKRSDEICDEITNMFEKRGSARGMVGYVNKRYDSESVVAGIAMNMVITEFLRLKKQL